MSFLNDLANLIQHHTQPQAAPQHPAPAQLQPQTNMPQAIHNPMPSLNPAPHQMGAYDLQRPLGLGSYQQDSPNQVPLQMVSPNIQMPQFQGSGRQVQPSWDDPNQIRTNNLRVY